MFGAKDFSGKLTQTWYSNDFITKEWKVPFPLRPDPEWSMLVMDMHASNESNFPMTNPGRGYRFYKGKPVFPFGHGQSYADVRLVRLRGRNETNTDLLVEHMNHGEPGVKRNFGFQKRPVRHVLLFYTLRNSIGKSGEKYKALCNFEEVFVEPGGSASGVQHLAKISGRLEIDQHFVWVLHL